jgi:hypothetical protein
MSERDLTESENYVFLLVQEIYGEQNDINQVFFMDNTRDACISIKDNTGNFVMMANLTNLATWRNDGTIKSDDELKEDWLTI